MTTAAKRKALLDILTLEEKVQTLAMQTYRKWLPDARAAAVPEVASFTLPPDALNIVTTQASWEVALDSTFMEGMGKLLNAQILGSLQEAGISTLPATLQPTEVTTPKPLNTNTIQNVPTLEEFRRDYLTDVRNRMVNTPDTVFRQIAESIRQGTEQGESVDELRDRVEHLLSINNTGTWTNRAATVARTESAGAYNAAILEAAKIQQNIQDKPLHQAWLSTIDKRTRRTHAAADGQRVELGHKFSVGRAELRFPGDPRGPAAEVINCVVGSTEVGWTGQSVIGTTHRSYTGTVVHLRTSDECVLTITPNHPVLTSRGYVPAGDLRPGDSVYTSGGVSSPYVDQVPSCIEQVHRSACERWETQRVVGTGVDFHGDGTDSEVHVVRTNGKLGNVHDSSGIKYIHHDLLVRTDHGQGFSPDRSAGDTAVLLDLVHDSTDVILSARPVRSGDASAAVLWASTRHAEAVSLTSPADWEIEFGQSSDDDGSGDAEVFRHTDHARSIGMELSELVSVEFSTGDHDVYNLTTSDEWYTANGIAVHNCRCSVQIVNAADDLPEESDRQTERGPGDATVRNRDGSRQDQIDKWRADGIIRARDDLFGVGVAASANQENTMTEFRSFTAKLMPLGVLARDGAQMTATDVKLVDTKLPLAGKWQEKDSPGHEDGFTVAVLETVEVDGDWVVGTGFMLNTPESAQAQEQSTLGVTQPSVEFVARESVMTDADGNVLDEMQAEEMWWNGETIIMTYTTIEMLGFTMVSVPNFRDTSVTFGEMVERDNGEVEQEAIAASAALVIPVEPVYPEELFSDPHLTELTPIHVTNDGRVIGHAAPWDQCHTGKPGKCKTAYHSFNGYADFHQSHVKLEDGSRLRVGRLTVGGGHAVVGHGMAPAVEHYDNVATCWAKVRAGEDEHGIWVSGVVNPDADPAMVKLALGTPHSGHWERVGGAPELIGIHAVNTPGYPLVKRTEDRFGVTALVASFMPRQARKLDTSILDEVASRAAKQAVTEYRNQEFGFRRKQSAQEVIAMASKRRREMVQQLVNSKGGQ